MPIRVIVRLPLTLSRLDVRFQQLVRPGIVLLWLHIGQRKIIRPHQRPFTLPDRIHRGKRHTTHTRRIRLLSSACPWIKRIRSYLPIVKIPISQMSHLPQRIVGIRCHVREYTMDEDRSQKLPAIRTSSEILVSHPFHHLFFYTINLIKKTISLHTRLAPIPLIFPISAHGCHHPSIPSTSHRLWASSPRNSLSAPRPAHDLWSTSF